MFRLVQRPPGWGLVCSGVAAPAEVVAAVLPLALAVPDGDPDGSGAAFDTAITANEVADDFDRILCYLGRSPVWAPASPC